MKQRPFVGGKDQGGRDAGNLKSAKKGRQFGFARRLALLIVRIGGSALGGNEARSSDASGQIDLFPKLEPALTESPVCRAYTKVALQSPPCARFPPGKLLDHALQEFIMERTVNPWDHLTSSGSYGCPQPATVLCQISSFSFQSHWPSRFATEGCAEAQFVYRSAHAHEAQKNGLQITQLPNGALGTGRVPSMSGKDR